LFFCLAALLRGRGAPAHKFILTLFVGIKHMNVHVNVNNLVELLEAGDSTVAAFLREYTEQSSRYWFVAWLGVSAADAMVTGLTADVIPPRPKPAAGYIQDVHDKMCKAIYPEITDTALRHLRGE